MDESFVSTILEYSLAQPLGVPFPPASEVDIEEAEERLGVDIPIVLRSIYLRVGNGGFGPGRGGRIIGLNGGYASDFGTLVETYERIKAAQAAEGKKWKVGLLPFCEWGCNIFSCVDVNESKLPMSVYENSEIWPRSYTFDGFVKMWVNGVDILSCDGTATADIVVINPFSAENMRVSTRKPK